MIELRELRSGRDGWVEQSTLTSQAPSPETTRGEQADTDDITGPESLAPGTLRPTSSAEYIVSEIRTHKKGAALFLAAFVLAISGIGYGLYRLLYPNPHIGQSGTMKQTRLTHSGNVASAGMSPDGRFVAYVTTGSAAEGSSLRVIQVATNNDVQIVPRSSPGISYHAPTFSPDGNFVYFTSRDEATYKTALYQVSVLGASPRKVMEDVRTRISFSPDGRRFAFIWDDRFHNPKLMIANSDGTGEQPLLESERSGFGDVTHGAGGVAWSPKGDFIAFVARRDDEALSVMQVPVRDGAEKPITSQVWINIRGLAWLPDGSGLILAGAGDNSQFLSQQCWLISYPSGEVQQRTHDLTDYWFVSPRPDSGAFVTVGVSYSANIWITPNAQANQGRQITFGANNVAGGAGVAWAPDGRIVYHSAADGMENIWITQADGSQAKQLTKNAGWNINPSVCPDGRYIVFDSTRSGTRSIWRMDLDGGDLKQLARGGGQTQCSPDSRWVIYSADFHTLKKVSIDGGDPVQVTEQGLTVWPSISPDGKLIAAWYREAPATPGKIAIIPSEGGEPVKQFDAILGSQTPCIRWAPDGRAVTYVSNKSGVDNIWSQAF